MDWVTSRMTLYAVITEVEDDLRRIVRTHLANAESLNELLGRDLLGKAQERYVKENETDGDDITLERALLYIDFGDYLEILNRFKKALPTDVRSHLRRNAGLFSDLIPVRNRVMHARPLDYSDVPLVMEGVRGLVSQLAELWPSAHDVLERLQEDPSFVLGLSIPCNDMADSVRKHNLPSPDFDDTGFIGREDEIKKVKRALSGAYPVVSILGEGGIGKSALAVKVGYDFLDSPEPMFDAVVWVTAKAATLTPTTIRDMEGAICSSLGLLQDAARHLAGEKNGSIEELLEYLKTFHILLILDNLETVIDDTLLEFFEGLPSGSKVLITSRISLGAFDFPVKLSPLPAPEAVKLLRASARNRGIGKLVEMPNEKLAKLCARMQNNPGFIKWFAIAVSVGQRPEDVLSKPDLFYDYCMSNVYQYLSSASIEVLGILHHIGRECGLAEIAFMSETDAVDVQRCLQQLIQTNMVRIVSQLEENSFESSFMIGEFARSYLTRHHPVSRINARKWGGMRKKLTAVAEETRASLSKNPLSISSIYMRSNADAIPAKHLLEALKACKVKDYSSAETALDSASRLSPDYFEVHRVAAWVKSFEGDMHGADNEYKAALELMPEHAPLMVWYAGFLLRNCNEPDQASAYLEQAEALMPKEPQIVLELARIQLHKREYAKAQEGVEEVLSNDDCSILNKKKAYDTYLQVFRRQAEELNQDKDYDSCLRLLGCLRECFEHIPPALLDDKMRCRLDIVPSLGGQCKHNCSSAISKKKAEELVVWASDRIENRPLLTGEHVGTIKSLVKVKDESPDYGFIACEHSNDVYFNQNMLKCSFEWGHLEEGSKVMFRTRKPQGGRIHAVLVRLLQQLPDNLFGRLEGTVIQICEDRFGFIESDAGDRFYFNRRSTSQSLSWADIQEGDIVSFQVHGMRDGYSASELRKKRPV